MNRRTFIHLGTSALSMATLTFRERTFSALTFTSTPGLKEMTASDFRSSRKFVDSRQGQIAYVEKGTGPVALFLHGFPLNSFQWRGIVPHLSLIRRCVAPDFLALGYTEVANTQSVAPQAQVQMLLELLDRLSISQVDLVANDSGGAIAQLLVGQRPERVRSLLLTNCDTEPESPPPAVQPVIELARAGKFADEWLVPWVKDKALARSANGIGGQCYQNSAHPTNEAIDTYLQPLVSSHRRKMLTNSYASALAPNPLKGMEPRLKQFKAPTRIVWGDADTIFSRKSADYLSQIFSNCRGVRHLEKSKLFFPEEEPAVIVEEARRLWSS